MVFGTLTTSYRSLKVVENVGSRTIEPYVAGAINKKLPNSQPREQNMRYVDQLNAFEDELSIYSPDKVDDLLPVLKIPFQYQVLVDAEMEVVGIIHKDKADVLLELLNWACANYPYKEEI